MSRTRGGSRTVVLHDHQPLTPEDVDRLTLVLRPRPAPPPPYSNMVPSDRERLVESQALGLPFRESPDIGRWNPRPGTQLPQMPPTSRPREAGSLFEPFNSEEMARAQELRNDQASRRESVVNRNRHMMVEREEEFEKERKAKEARLQWLDDQNAQLERDIDQSKQKQKELASKKQEQDMRDQEYGRSGRVMFNRALAIARGFVSTANNDAPSTSSAPPAPPTTQDALVHTMVNLNVGLVREVIVQNRASRDDIDDIISVVNRNFDALVASHQRVGLQRHHLDRVINQTNAALRSMQQEFERGQDRLGTRIDYLQQVVGTQRTILDNRMKEFERKQARQDAEIGQLRNEVDEVDTNTALALEGQDGKIASMEKKFDKFERNYLKSAMQLQDANERDYRTGEELAKHGGKLQDHEDRIGALESGTTDKLRKEYKHEIDSLAYDVTRMGRDYQRSIDSHATEVEKKLKAKMDATLKEEKGKMDALLADKKDQMTSFVRGLKLQNILQDKQRREQTSRQTSMNNAILTQLADTLEQQGNAIASTTSALTSTTNAIATAMQRQQQMASAQQSATTQQPATTQQSAPVTVGDRIRNARMSQQNRLAANRIGGAVKGDPDPGPGDDDGGSDDDSVAKKGERGAPSPPPSDKYPAAPPSSFSNDMRYKVMNKDKGFHQDILINITLQQMGRPQVSNRPPPPLPDISGHRKRGRQVPLKRIGKKRKLSALKNK